MSKWISVEERSPVLGVFVLAFFDGDYEVLQPARAEGWLLHWFDAQGKELNGINVTHWMPLPLPPTEYNDER